MTASRCCPAVPAPQPQPRQTGPDDLATELNPHKTELNPHKAGPRRLAAPEQIKSGPLGLANFKIIPISLLPLGVRIVPSDEPVR